MVNLLRARTVSEIKNKTEPVKAVSSFNFSWSTPLKPSTTDWVVLENITERDIDFKCFNVS